MIYPKRIKEINTYLVELIIDLYEQVSVYVDAYSESEADAIGITMFDLLQYDPNHSDSPHSNQIHSPIY